MKHRHRSEEKRIVGLLLIPAVIATALSTVSFAQPRTRGLTPGWEIMIEGDMIDQLIGEDGPSVATGSTATASTPSIHNGDPINPELPEDLRVHLEWKKLFVEEEAFYDTEQPELRPEFGMEVFDDTTVGFQMKVTIPQANSVGDGDQVEHIIGRIPGLNLAAESRGSMILNEIFIGYASLCYSEDGVVSIRTEFTDGMQNFSSVNITYRYTTGWISVSRRTPVHLMMSDWQESSLIYLVPRDGEEPTEEPSTEEPTTEEPSTEEPTTEEPTTEEPSTEKPTTEEPSTEEPTTEEPTTEEPTTEEPTYRWNRGSGGSGSSGGSKVTPQRAVQSETEMETEVLSSEDIEDQRTPTEEMQNIEESLQIELPESTLKEEESTTQEELDATPVIKVEAVKTSGDYINPGDDITYQIEIRNESEIPIKNLRVRNYLPEHTSFVKHDELGVYGMIDGRQHVTWNIEKVDPGKTMYCRLTVKAFVCIPENYSIENRVYYQVDDKTSANDPRDPDTEEVTSSLNIR